MARRIVTRKQADSIKLDGPMACAFIDSLWDHVKDPDKIQRFWSMHKDKLMAWWTEGIELACDEPIIQLNKIEERLFFRPELWWVFEAKEPLKHFMVTTTDHIKDRPPGFKSEFCMVEDEGLYLKRCGLLSEIEKQTEYKPEDYWEKTYQIKEVSRFLVPANATACEHWKCHISTLDWKQRLGFSYSLENRISYKDINPDQYQKANKGHTWS